MTALDRLTADEGISLEQIEKSGVLAGLPIEHLRKFLALKLIELTLGGAILTNKGREEAATISGSLPP